MKQFQGNTVYTGLTTRTGTAADAAARVPAMEADERALRYELVNTGQQALFYAGTQALVEDAAKRSRLPPGWSTGWLSREHTDTDARNRLWVICAATESATYELNVEG